MVLLVLAIIWGVLLVSWLRSRTEGSFSDSVGTFRRHLTVLERATPSTVVPANRLRSGPVAGRAIPAYRPAARGISGARLAGPARPTSVGGPGLRPPSAAALRRRHAQKRRRDVFFALLAGLLGSLALAIIPGLSVIWPVQILFDLAFGGYVALLIRLRNLAAERELKLRFMPYQQQQQMPRIGARPKPAYEFGGGYGELTLPRAATN